MTQKALFPEQFIETVTCPCCGFSGDVDNFDCGGMPDGIVICNQPAKPKNKWNKGLRCSCFIDTRTMTEWDVTGDDDE